MANNNKLIVFDCDPGIDDALAISLGLLIHNDPAVVITCYGCSEISTTTRNARLLLDLLGRHEVPVIRGASRPLIWPHPIELKKIPTFFGKNGLNDIELPKSGISGDSISPKEEAFVEYVYNLFQSADSIDYYLTGPCTNLAKVCLKYPELVKTKLNGLYIMGGAFGAGNSGTKDLQTGLGVSEFNFYLDPIAFHLLLSLDLYPKLVTWDQAKKFSISHSTVSSLNSNSKAIQYLFDALRNFFILYPNDTVLESEKSEEPFVILSDPIVLLTDHDSGQLVDKKMDIVIHGPDYGRCIESDNGHNVSCFEFTDSSYAMDYFLEKIGAVTA